MPIPVTQITYRLTDFEGFQSIKRFEEPLDAKLDNGLVMIKVKAVALNYCDLFIADNTYPPPVKKGVIPISDVCGEVVKVGASVTDLKVGDRVISNCIPDRLYGQMKDPKTSLGSSVDGLLTQYRILPYYAFTKLPEDCHLSDEEAATLSCAGVTAWNALFGIKECFIPGQIVLMLVTGGVSIITLILANAAGAKTIITSSSDEKLELVKELYGFDHGINYKTHPDWDKEVMKVTKNQGVDFVIENGGNGTITKSINSVKVGGQVSLIGFLDTVAENPNVVQAVLLKSAILRGVAIGSKELSEQLVQFVSAKKLPMPIEKVYGFSQEEVHQAYAKLQSQSFIGKITIKID